MRHSGGVALPLGAEWSARLTAAIAAVDDDAARSALPADPPPEAVAAIDDWLRDVRKRSW